MFAIVMLSMVEGMSVIVNVVLSLSSMMSPPLNCAPYRTHGGKIKYFVIFTSCTNSINEPVLKT